MSEKPESTISEGLKFTGLIYGILKSQDSVQSTVRTVTYTIIGLIYSLKKFKSYFQYFNPINLMCCDK